MELGTHVLFSSFGGCLLCVVTLRIAWTIKHQAPTTFTHTLTSSPPHQLLKCHRIRWSKTTKTYVGVVGCPPEDGEWHHGGANGYWVGEGEENVLGTEKAYAYVSPSWSAAA